MVRTVALDCGIDILQVTKPLPSQVLTESANFDWTSLPETTTLYGYAGDEQNGTSEIGESLNWRVLKARSNLVVLDGIDESLVTVKPSKDVGDAPEPRRHAPGIIGP